MSEVATYLKVGATSIVLAMIEDDVMGDDLMLANPVGAIRQVSHDPSLQRTVLLRSGRRATALEIQWSLLERARKYERSHGLESVGDEVGADVLRRWEGVLTGLEHDPDSVSDVVDWVAKRRVVQGFAERHGLRSNDARLKALDLQYHDMRPDKCLANRVGLQTITDRRGGAPGDDRAAHHHPRLLPRPLPGQVAGRHRRRELGLARVRHRPRPACVGCR